MDGMIFGNKKGEHLLIHLPNAVTMEEILAFLKSIYPLLSEECLTFLRSVVKKRILKRNEYVLLPGEVCRNLYFIKKGLMRCYYVLDGRELTDWVFSENAAVVSVDSFYDQVPSDEFVQALEPCELYYISFDNLELAYRCYVEFNFVGRVLTLKYLRIWHDLVRKIRALEAEERYNLLVKEQPELVLRVKQKVLATWLDMHPGTLSRLRSKLKKLTRVKRGKKRPS
jgi:CRP-like cAMP-binding protein